MEELATSRFVNALQPCICWSFRADVDLLMSWDFYLFNVVFDFYSWLLCNLCSLVFSAGRVIVHNL